MLGTEGTGDECVPEGPGEIEDIKWRVRSFSATQQKPSTRPSPSSTVPHSVPTYTRSFPQYRGCSSHCQG